MHQFHLKFKTRDLLKNHGQISEQCVITVSVQHYRDVVPIRLLHTVLKSARVKNVFFFNL